MGMHKWLDHFEHLCEVWGAQNLRLWAKSRWKLEGKALQWWSSLPLAAKENWQVAQTVLLKEFVCDAAYEGALSKHFENLVQANGEQVRTYAKNFKLVVSKMFEDTSPSEY